MGFLDNNKSTEYCPIYFRILSSNAIIHNKSWSTKTWKQTVSYQNLPGLESHFPNPLSEWFLLIDTGSVKSGPLHRCYCCYSMKTWYRHRQNNGWYKFKLSSVSVLKAALYLRSGSGASKAVKSSIKVIAFTVASSPSTGISVWPGVLRKRHRAITQICTACTAVLFYSLITTFIYILPYAAR